MTEPIRLELPTQYEAGPVNAYLFVEPEPVLVDTGVKSEQSWQVLVAALAAYGLAVRDLTRVVLTHAHVDHFGQAQRLVEEGDLGLETAVVVADRLVHFSRYWQNRTVFYRDIFLPQTGLPAQMTQYLLAYFDMVAKLYTDIPAAYITTFPVGSTIELGGLLWEVLHTPGHCSHQTCFYQPDTKQFLASDMLLPRTPTPVVEYPPDGKTRRPSLPLYLESMDRVEALDAEIIYPGHGEVFRDHRGLIRQQRDRILARKAECLNCIRGGCRTIAEILQHLYAGRPMPIQFAGLWMTVGYLDLLAADKVISVTEVDGVYHYHPCQ